METPEKSAYESEDSSIWNFDVPKNFDFTNTPGPDVDKWFEKRKDTPWKTNTGKLSTLNRNQTDSSDTENAQSTDDEFGLNHSNGNKSSEQDENSEVYDSGYEDNTKGILKNNKPENVENRNSNVREKVKFDLSPTNIEKQDKKTKRKRLSLTPHPKRKSKLPVLAQTTGKIKSEADPFDNVDGWIKPKNELATQTTNNHQEMHRNPATEKKKVLFTTTNSPKERSKLENIIHSTYSDNESGSDTNTLNSHISDNTVNRESIEYSPTESNVTEKLNEKSEISSSKFNSFAKQLESIKNENTGLAQNEKVLPNESLKKQKRKFDSETETKMKTQQNESIKDHPVEKKRKTKATQLTKPIPMKFETDKRVRRNVGNKPTSKSGVLETKKRKVVNVKDGGSDQTTNKPKESNYNNTDQIVNSKDDYPRRVAKVGEKWMVKKPVPLTTTKTVPFSFETEKFVERKMARLKQVLEKIERMEKEQREFKAQPIPELKEPVLPEKKKIPVVVPEPFDLESDRRGDIYKKQLLEKKKELEKSRIERTKFKANPIPESIIYPFIPMPSTKPPTEVSNIILNTELRHDMREAWEEGFKEREANKELILEKLRAEAIEREKEEIKRLRERLVHSPLPIPEYVPPVIHPSDKQLTVPKSPSWTYQMMRRANSRKLRE
ncbi:hypothetical protein BB558_000968 [Smittium angustum]|uniref:TPX2 C-terminal domain-containing protein n=1 Tax=Smittium angustum TaxID=133377 RepID=A0A2U1JCY9_SMIAN|nr:hypothetical protein BB558_000968 [Smittium angustum]